jgi:hypothetical protein
MSLDAASLLQRLRVMQEARTSASADRTLYFDFP